MKDGKWKEDMSDIHDMKVRVWDKLKLVHMLLERKSCQLQ